MSKYGKRAAGLLLTGVLCAGLLAGCGGAPEAAVTPTAPSESGSASGRRVETLRLEGGTDWGVPNPYLHQSRGPGTAKMRLVYGSLLEKDETGDVPWLAERWSMDGNDYTFTLFADAQFQDGAPLTTADVAFTLDYYQEHPPVSNSLGVGDSYLVDHYTVVDEQTITITVKEANADTLSNLGSFVILPKHIWENVDDPNAYTGEGYLTGSGAYACTDYDGATGSYEFTAFDGWCNGEQAAEKIQFVPVSDPLLAFESGEIDITSLPADLMDAYLNDPSIGVVEKANDMGYKLLINYERCPDFLELALRQGVYAAIDRQSVVDSVFRGAGTVGSAGYVPQGSLYYNENVAQYPYDPEAARAVFAGKGYSVTLLCGDDGGRPGHRGDHPHRPHRRGHRGGGGGPRLGHPGRAHQQRRLRVRPGGQRRLGQQSPHLHAHPVLRRVQVLRHQPPLHGGHRLLQRRDDRVGRGPGIRDRL